MSWCSWVYSILLITKKIAQYQSIFRLIEARFGIWIVYAQNPDVNCLFDHIDDFCQIDL